MKVKFKLLSPLAKAPTKAHATDAGFDLVATSKSRTPDACITYGTSLAVEIPKGYVGYIFPRSSLSKYDITLTNSVGVIDSGYTGEITFKFKPTLWAQQRDAEDPMLTAYIPDLDYDLESYQVGDRIGQLIIMPISDIEFEQVEELSPSERGNGGYGSTGK